MRLIFETLTNHDGTAVDPPHRIVKNVKQAVIRWEEDTEGEHGQAEHTWLVVRNAGNNHEIARMWETAPVPALEPDEDAVRCFTSLERDVLQQVGEDLVV